MKAVIMGAGSGTRMFPLTHFINKHLLHLGGKPVIRIIAERIAQVIKPHNITIVCNKKDEQDYRWEFRDMAVNFKPFDKKMETAGTARQFAAAIMSIDYLENEPVLLHYGDTITDLNYSEFLDYWQYHYRDGLIAITKNIKHDYSQVVTTGDIVRNIKEKPQLSLPSWTGIGIFNAEKIKDEILQYGQENQGSSEVDLATHIFPRMVEKGTLYAYEYNGRWFDVGNLRSYRLLVEEFQDKDLKL